jgi:hypothetical protein
MVPSIMGHMKMPIPGNPRTGNRGEQIGISQALTLKKDMAAGPDWLGSAPAARRDWTSRTFPSADARMRGVLHPENAARGIVHARISRFTAEVSALWVFESMRISFI